MDETIMDRLMAVKGYLGGAINNHTGECLICHANKLSGNLEEISATFNDIFTDAHKISTQLKLGKTDIVEIHTEKAIILMACSGANAKFHIHMFALFQHEGNITLGKMALGKIIPEAIEILDK